MNLEKTQVFDIADVVNAGRDKNPFELTEVEDRFVKRSMPAFLNSLVKYSADLNYNLIDFRKYGDCFAVPYDDKNFRDSYLWRMDEFIMGDPTVFTRSCGSREEMVGLLDELLKEDNASSNLALAINSLSSTFNTIINDFYRSSTNVKYRSVNADYVKGLINGDRMPETDLSKEQTLYCCEIIKNSMNEAQENRAELAADLEREQLEMGN